jgi:hypothetical protein
MSWRIVTHHTLKLVIPGVLAWLHFAGVPSALLPVVIEAARAEGLHLGFSRMRLSILQGLILDDVRIRSEQVLDNPEVAMDRATVAFNWRLLLRGRVELTSLDLHGAQLFLPVLSEGGVTRTLRLTQASARLMLSDGIVSVPFASFNLQGVNVVASGQILPGEPSPAKNAEATTKQENEGTGLLPPGVARALEILEMIDFGPVEPVLEIEFVARAGDPDAFRISWLHLEAPRADYDGATLRDIRMEATYDARVLDIRRLAARDDRGGLLAVSGQWDTASGRAEAEMDWSLNPAPWLAALAPDGPWRDLDFDKPPNIRATLQMPPGGEPRILVRGALAAGAFRLRGSEFGGLRADFAWRDGDLYVNGLQLDLPTGQIEADFMMQPGDVRLRVDCRADPLPLTVLLDPKALEQFAKLELNFIDPPVIRIEASGDKLAPESIKAHGEIKLSRTSIHGSPMDSAKADVAFENMALKFTNMQVKRPEGAGTGAFTYDFGLNQVRLEGIRSTMNPVSVLLWADPNVARETEPYRFKAPPEVTVNGLIGLKNHDQTRLTAKFTASQGLDYDLLDRTLSFGTTSGELQFRGRQILVKIPSAQLYGGMVKLDATIDTSQPGARHKVAVDLSQVNFETLTRLYFDYQGSKGEVSGRYDFSLVPQDGRQMRGTGNLTVTDGNVFAIPVLGPLSVLLGAIIPGTGYQTSRKATCDFRVADGEIRTDNLNVLGTGFTMIGQGSLFFLEDRMDFAVRVNAQGVPGLLLYPVSKLMEYVSDGKLSEPKWRPRLLPKGGGPKPKPEAKPAEPTARAGRNGRA